MPPDERRIEQTVGFAARSSSAIRPVGNRKKRDG